MIFYGRQIIQQHVFSDNRLEAGFFCELIRTRVCVRRDANDPQARVVFEQFLGGFKAVHARQVDVQNNQVRVDLLAECNRTIPISYHIDHLHVGQGGKG